jgi:hypothetical protein
MRRSCILRERDLSRQASVRGLFMPSSGAHASPRVLLDAEDDDPDHRPTVQEEVPPA